MKRELGDLTPVRSVVAWLEEQAESIAAPAESVRLITEIRRKLSEALDDAQHAELEGLSVPEYARLVGEKPSTIYKRAQRGQIPVKRIGRDLRIPIDPAA